MYQVIFSDVDGTLLNSDSKVSPGTRDAIIAANEKGIPFIIVSARGPASIYPILDKMGITSPIIAYCGALIQDEKKNVLYSTGFSLGQAERIIDYLEYGLNDVAWCAYVGDDWYVATRDDQRIRDEEGYTETVSIEGRIEDLPPNTIVNKILCISDPVNVFEVAEGLRERFPFYEISLSADYLIEIMPGGINKAGAVEKLCGILGIDPSDTVAFGDNYNDAEMLRAVGRGILMGNAPADLLESFDYIAADNDHDGMAVEIRKLFEIDVKYE